MDERGVAAEGNHLAWHPHDLAREADVAIKLRGLDDLSGHQHAEMLLLGPDLGLVHAADVPRVEPPQEADVEEGGGAEARDSHLRGGHIERERWNSRPWR